MMRCANVPTNWLRFEPFFSIEDPQVGDWQVASCYNLIGQVMRICRRKQMTYSMRVSTARRRPASSSATHAVMEDANLAR